jgi:hypothetical protein
MNWKRKFDEAFGRVEALQHFRFESAVTDVTDEVKEFISTEIIEKLIEETIDRASIFDWGKLDPDETVELQNNLKQQLRERWL